MGWKKLPYCSEATSILKAGLEVGEYTQHQDRDLK